MNYATQYPIGNYLQTQAENTTTIAPTNWATFAQWMQRTKDADEVRKDKQKSVPIAMLPIIF